MNQTTASFSGCVPEAERIKQNGRVFEYEYLSGLMNGSATLSVVGLGYVGMPLAVAFAKKLRVIGFDLNAEKIRLYHDGLDPTGEVGNDAIRKRRSVSPTMKPASKMRGSISSRCRRRSTRTIRRTFPPSSAPAPSSGETCSAGPMWCSSQRCTPASRKTSASPFWSGNPA